MRRVRRARHRSWPLGGPKQEATTNKDGSKQLVAAPMPLGFNDWHTPVHVVPEHQWSPETGMTRYEWARQETPEDQIQFFVRMQVLYRKQPPQPLTEEVAKKMQAGVITLPTGLQGYNQEVMELLERSNFEHHLVSPDDCWRFTLLAASWGDGILDKVIISHRDYRTLPDWELLLRTRSWLWQDERDSFMWLPGQDVGRPGWETRYENGRPNALQLCSPRIMQSDCNGEA